MNIASGSPQQSLSCRIVKLWIWLSALASLAGWSLSAIGQLNRAGYALFFLAAAVIFFAWHRGRQLRAGELTPKWKSILYRFRRPFPLAFAVLALLVLAGGLIYPPSNYTGLTYRVGRVLQWLDHGQWWWIHTPDYRMNDRACGAEWLYTPALLFTRSDRPLFLINYLPFLLMPGLIFSVFTRLGVRRRVAWCWMWLLPTGYDFLLQAGSIANDTFPTIYGLAAFDFILRARASGRISDVWYSLVAAALLTGAKASNLPLLLPWAILAWPVAPVLKRGIVATGLVLLVAALVSFLPIAILNAHYCGDWTGANLEIPNMTMKHPWTGAWGNAFQLLLENFAPPLMPLAGWWNAHAHSILPDFLVRAAAENFTVGFFYIGELPTEDWAGIGCGLSVLLVISIAAGFRVLTHPRAACGPNPVAFTRPALWAVWLALLAYCMKSGMENAARIIAPYYPLLVASLVAGAAQAEIVRRGWWRKLAGGTLFLAFIILVLSPDRPLWPANTILARWSSGHPNLQIATRARNVYSIFAARHDALACVRAILPANVNTIGLVAGVDDNDIALWRPFGSRRVEHFMVTDSPDFIWSRVHYVVVGGFNLSEHHMSIQDWLRINQAEMVASTNTMVKLAEGRQNWYLTRLKP